MKEKKIKKVKPQKECAKNAYDFSKPHEYFKSGFGKDREEINVHVLNINVSDMLDDFKVFEDLNNVQSWPISTLIQRELDHDRASLICRDYLLRQGDTKYFPPLIAVLIPTDNEYKPLESFDDVQKSELENIFTKFIKGEEAYENYEKPFGLSKGISLIPFTEEQGDIVWDKNSVSAVIIDGQHRYKALQEAKERDKTFLGCRVTITLVDLTVVCKKSKKTPTDVARDLFVTINNTPVEVDETRLVLMDDKDVLSTFTQVLIDDSNDEQKPALPPMLIDWECEGAKHNTTNSLSGVLVLRQIILSAMFDDSKVSTVEDRSNVRNVRKWKSKLEDWMSPDSIIKEKLSAEETIEHRFKIAEADSSFEQDEDDEDSIFLFSFSATVSKILKERFKQIFLSSFRTTFNDLQPYAKLIELATEHGILSPDKPLNNYYRSFKGKRAALRKDADINKSVSLYESQFSKITGKSILYTVMGQKSVFKALFDGFLSQATEKNEQCYKEMCDEFVEGFNEAFNCLTPSGNSDESFFNADYKMRRNVVHDAKSAGKDFWKGIIIKSNGEIDYSKSAVGIFSQILQDIIFHSYSDADENKTSKKGFEFSDYNKLVARHERLIIKLELTDPKKPERAKALAEKIVQAKQKELQRLLSQH
jgi:hypothetical protein